MGGGCPCGRKGERVEEEEKTKEEEEEGGGAEGG